LVEFWDILDVKGNKTGRFHERGKLMKAGEYHLIVSVWIVNSKGEFLVSRRNKNIWHGLKWQATGGCAVNGDNSLTTALKEAQEEIGVILDPKKGQFFSRYYSPHTNGEGTSIIDIWLFRQEVDISAIVLCPEETCDAMWATKEKIRQWINYGEFLAGKEAYPYIEEILEWEL